MIAATGQPRETESATQGLRACKSLLNCSRAVLDGQPQTDSRRPPSIARNRCQHDVALGRPGTLVIPPKHNVRLLATGHRREWTLPLAAGPETRLVNYRQPFNLS